MKSDPPAATVGSCRVRERLASGGFGTVYRGFDAQLNVERAVKVIHPHVIAQKGFRERFLTELRLSAALDHQNIVRVLYAVEEATVCGYVMEFVPGVTLRRKLRECGRLGPPEAVNVVLQSARAVQYSQSRKPPIIHRDLTPENVMIRPDGVVKVMDYGIAAAMEDPALAVSKMIVGKPKYMPPEQFEGEVTIGADLYALGVILYECLTGAPPFEGASPMAIYRAHVLQAPRAPSESSPGIPAVLDAIILRALAKDPAERWPDASLFVAALEHADAVLKGFPGAPPRALETLLRPPAAISTARVPTPEEQALVEEAYSRGFDLLSNQKYAEATDAFDRALKLDPAHFESRRNRRVARLRRLEVSETHVERSRLSDIEVGAMRHAQGLFSERRWEEAAAAFDRVLMINPDRLDARRFRYESQERAAGESEERRKSHEKALSALVRARVSMDAGRLEEAAAAAVEALAAEPDNEDARLLAARAGAERLEASTRAGAQESRPPGADPVLASLRDGIARFAGGEFEGAAALLSAALAEAVDSTLARKYLELCRRRLAEMAEARADLARLDASSPEATPPAAPAIPAPGTGEKLVPSDGGMPVITAEDLGPISAVAAAPADSTSSSALRAAVTPPPVPVSAQDPSGRPPFVGRGNTLQAMDRALDEIPRGRGGCFLVKGRPGVGKSRLLEEFARRHDYRNAGFLSASCSGDLGDYLGPWKPLAWGALRQLETTNLPAYTRLAMRLAPELGRLGEPFRRIALDHGRNFDTTATDERIRALLVELFSGVLEHRSLVLTIDALESADSETLAVLERLAALARERPLILLGAVSQSRAADTNPWARFYNQFRPQKLAQEFLVPRLPEDEVRMLLGSVFAQELRHPVGSDVPRADTRLAAEVSRAADGNLHQLLKICRHLAQTGLVAEDAGVWKLARKGPLTEDDLIAGLADTLFGRFRSLNARQGSVLRWLSLSEDGLPFDALSEVTGLAQAELFHALHELAAQKLTGESDDTGKKVITIPSPVLRQRIYAETPAADRPARHDRAAAALDRVDRSAPERAAAQALRGTNADKAVDLCFRASDAALEAGRISDARRWLERAEDWLGRTRIKGALTAHADRMGRVHLASGAPDAALRAFQSVLAAGPTPDRPSGLRLDLARCHLLLGRRREAADAAALALEKARDRRDEIAAILFQARLALAADDLETAGRLLESARPEAESAGLAGPALEGLAAFRFAGGDVKQAEADAEEALQRGGALDAHLTLARCRIHQGKSLSAAARLESALAGCQDKVLEAELLTALASARTAAGRIPAARMHAAAAIAAARTAGATATAARAELAAAENSLAAREYGPALEAAVRAQQGFDSIGHRPGLTRALLALAEACTGAGDPARALGYADLAAAGAQTAELAGLLLLVRAEAVFRAGRPGEARSAFHDALKHFGARWKDAGWIARAFSGLAQLHAANGDREKSAENTARALRALRETDLALAGARVRVAGARTSEAAAIPSNAAGELAREVEESAAVLEAAGCTAEAAAAREFAVRLVPRAG